DYYCFVYYSGTQYF
nr:immunoglobulin light chain junction region [Macaca mulatta]